MKSKGWKKMFATLALGGLILAAPQLANANIASDINAGKNAAVAAQEAVRGGMTPVAAALAATKADPQSAVAVAVAVAKENPKSAVDVAVALAEAEPDQAVAIAQAVSQVYPDQAQEIAQAVSQLYPARAAEIAAATKTGTPTGEGYESPNAPHGGNLVPSSIMGGSIGGGGGAGQDTRPASRI